MSFLDKAPSLRRVLLGALALLVVVVLAYLVAAQPWMATGPETRPGWSVLRPPHDVNALVLFEDKVLAGGRDGLVALDPQSGAVVPLGAGIPEMAYVKALLVDRTGTLWVGHRTGLARRDATGWSETAVSASTPPGPIAALVELSDGQILAGGEAGLASVSSGALVTMPLPAPHAHGGVSALFEDAAGRLWIGFSSPTQGGLLVKTGEIWRELTRDDGLVHLSINAIAADSRGRLLVASGYSGRGGGCRLDDLYDLGSWTCLQADDGLASDMVRLIAEDSHGQSWYGSEFKGIAVARDGLFSRFGPADGLAGTELKAFVEDLEGNLWLGCDKGLTRIASSASLVAGQEGGPRP